MLMCGITAIISKNNLKSTHLVKSNEIIAHRGPDDEGFALWRPNSPVKILAGEATTPASRAAHQLINIQNDVTNWQVGLGHRRLSILDLSPAGHQPMLLSDKGLTLSFNGEIYNYLELREELKELGHQFKTATDTEVILHAWSAWGINSLSRFNGMFAFVLLDSQQQKLYAVRDRFGVKPLYFTNCSDYLAFASEVKQLRLLPNYNFNLNLATTYDYLRYGAVDYSNDTFELGIEQVDPGYYIEVDLRNNQSRTVQWYTLTPKPWKRTFQDASDRFRELLKDSVRIRMRSDVPVGSALSGGLDSSTIVCLMREVLQDQGKGDHIIKTITSCQEDKKYDEWEYAQEVINKVNAQANQVFPSFEKLNAEIEQFMWHMDYPFGSTSQFSQWCVFEGAAKAGLKVMIDGQGADEQLAGYGGNDMAFYTGLLGSGQIVKFMQEVKAYRQYRGHWPTGFIIGAFQHHLPAKFLNSVPDRFRVRKQYPPNWLKLPNTDQSSNGPSSLAESLYSQVTKKPLPSLLRYEDRNSMAFSIESRVPFMDYRLIEFTLGLPERFVYKNGERKHILRHTFAGVVPSKVLTRRDKMGFVSAEERWLQQEGREWFLDEVTTAGERLPEIFHSNHVNSLVQEMSNGKKAFSFSPWQILSINRFIKMLD